MLGQEWFAGRVWTWDYPGRRLLWHPDGGLPAVEPSHRVTLGFQTDKAGRRTADFPRIAAIVDGQTLDFLFDTGAMVSLSPEALAKLGEMEDKGLPHGRPASSRRSISTPGGASTRTGR